MKSSQQWIRHEWMIEKNRWGKQKGICSKSVWNPSFSGCIHCAHYSVFLCKWNVVLVYLKWHFVNSSVLDCDNCAFHHNDMLLTFNSPSSYKLHSLVCIHILLKLYCCKDYIWIWAWKCSIGWSWNANSVFSCYTLCIHNT